MFQELKFEILPNQPAYSPNLKPFDYQIFGLLKNALCGHELANNEEVNMVHMWLHAQPKTVFTDGIRSLWIKLTDVWRS
jgi:hypothetical protein